MNLEPLIALQQQLARQVVLTETLSSSPKFIGGLDISFVKLGDKEVAAACCTVYNFSEPFTSSTKPVESVIHESEHPITTDYCPGFLGIREVPLYQDVLSQVSVPLDLVFVDGFGVLHPRRCGSASHLGVLTGLRTIGVAKNLLNLDEEGFPSEKQVREKLRCPDDPSVRIFKDIGFPRARGLPLLDLGYALIPNPDVEKPIYVSPGHLISLETALQYTLRTCLYKNPEPLRMADILSREYLRVKYGVSKFGQVEIQ